MKPLQPDDPRQIGRYAIVRVLGEGGMGRVFLGVYSEDDNQYFAAIKVMAARYTSDLSYRMRFQREIRAAQKVKGYFTARILESGVDGDALWFASEYIPGKTLNEAVDQELFTGTSLIVLAWSLYYAIAAIHSEGIVHRDLKPQNIILSQEGLRVIDFGVAFVPGESTITAAGATVGTPRYMGPDQIAGEHPVAAWDIFAFGCLLVYASTGHPAFGKNDDGPITVCNAVINSPPNLSGVPDSVRKLVEKCLNKNPSRRATLEDINKMLPRVSHSMTTGMDWLPASVSKGVAEVTRVMPAAGSIKRVILAQPKRLSQPKPPYLASPQSERPAKQQPPTQQEQSSKPFSDTMQIALIIAVIVLVLALANRCGLLDRDSEPQPAPSTSQTFRAPAIFDNGSVVVKLHAL